MTATFWIDVEDLFEYALHYSRPSGIQRLAFQLYRSLHVQLGDSGLVRFVRHNTARNTFYIVAWTEVAAVFDRLAGGKQPSPIQSSQSTMGGSACAHSSEAISARLASPIIARPACVTDQGTPAARPGASRLVAICASNCTDGSVGGDATRHLW